MKSLSKIIFINSAAIKFAEIYLDGNVHFIGTQGVGKSTALRAILFFYNADKLKLDIPRDKKTFDEYYFPFQNSYIIYEVQTGNTPYCVLAFKSQGRVAFRFFDSPFDKKFFIDDEGRAFESWDKTREIFGKNVYYTRIVQGYDEFRNILYGNNKGLASEFRKYAILESKQFQNIPRTITNVFHNTDLSAEFVKKTIIDSLNEEEVKIDLTTYSQNHLKDFEAHLNDIKRWIEIDRKGESAIQRQAESVAIFYSGLKHLEKRKVELAYQLGWAVNHAREQQPKEKEKLEAENLKKEKQQKKLNDLDSVFEERKKKIVEQVGKFKSKLEDIKTKKEEYATLKIENLLEKVSKKNSLELEKKNLAKEKEILTSKFAEIKQRFDALLAQLDNRLKEFENSMHGEKNTAKENFLHLKDELNNQYELLYDEIRKQHKEELENANNFIKEKDEAVTNLKIKKSEVKNKRFYENEIENCISEISKLTATIQKVEADKEKATEKNKNIQREWELEETRIKEAIQRKIDRQNEEQKKHSDSIKKIDEKIESSKDSFYGWLNEQVPNWEKTIGKVIDEENVLFKGCLNPQKGSKSDSNFFGINIDLKEINKTVKTVADYEKEKAELKDKIQEIQKAISGLNSECSEELEKLKRKFTPRIREQKEIISNCQYTYDQSKLRLDEKNVQLDEFKRKAEAEKKSALEKVEEEISKANDELINAKEKAQKIKGSINSQIDKKRKEKDGKLKTEQEKVNAALSKIDLEISNYKEEAEKKAVETRNKRKKELDSKQVDTKQLEEIEKRFTEVNSDLDFIEKNTSITERYKYDKEQLFDKEDEFKNSKEANEKKLETELTKHNQQKEKLIESMGIIKSVIESIKQKLSEYTEDLTSFESFTKLEGTYRPIETFVDNYKEEHHSNIRCTQLITELNQNYYAINDRLRELEGAINRFTGNFSENNIFSFKTKFPERMDYFEFAEMLNEFIDENKISEFVTRFNQRFANIIRKIGQETGELISKEGEISQVIRDINNDFIVKRFVQAIKSMELKTDKSENKILQLLLEIKSFNEANEAELGQPNLFSTDGQANKNEKAVSLLKMLIKEMATYKATEITLADSVKLLFRIVENDNDSGWVEKLKDVGSHGTDILVKAMVNIMLLNVFKERAAKKHKDDFRLHCMMDEIGQLHPTNIKGILKFANDRNILLINCAPTSYNATDYRYTYLLSKDSKNVTTVKRLVKKIPKLESEIATEAQ
jgi:hypothetical protein